MTDCCLFTRFSTSPPAPKTYYANKNFFARELNDCSKKISNEHIISRNVLYHLFHKNKIQILGPKFDKNTFISITSITSKVLCERHNNALSQLDELAFKFFSFLYLPSITQDFSMINGNELERWFLKPLCGFYSSGIAFDAVRDGWVPPKTWVDALFKIAPMPPSGGLNVISNWNYQQNFHELSLKPIDKDNRNAILLKIAGHFFIYTIMAIINYSPIDNNAPKLIKRPKVFLVIEDNCQREIHTGWFWGDNYKVVMEKSK